MSSHPQPCSVTQLSSIQVLTPSGRTVCSHACVKVGLSSTDGANRCHCFWRLVLFLMFTWLFLWPLWWSALRDSSVRYGHVHCSHTKIYFYFVLHSNLNSVTFNHNSQHISHLLSAGCCDWQQPSEVQELLSSHFTEEENEAQTVKRFSQDLLAHMTGPWWQPDGGS